MSEESDLETINLSDVDATVSEPIVDDPPQEQNQDEASDDHEPPSPPSPQVTNRRAMTMAARMAARRSAKLTEAASMVAEAREQENKRKKQDQERRKRILQERSNAASKTKVVDVDAFYDNQEVEDEPIRFEMPKASIKKSPSRKRRTTNEPKSKATPARTKKSVQRRKAREPETEVTAVAETEPLELPTSAAKGRRKQPSVPEVPPIENPASSKPEPVKRKAVETKKPTSTRTALRKTASKTLSMAAKSVAQKSKQTAVPKSPRNKPAQVEPAGKVAMQERDVRIQHKRMSTERVNESDKEEEGEQSFKVKEPARKKVVRSGKKVGVNKTQFEDDEGDMENGERMLDGKDVDEDSDVIISSHSVYKKPGFLTQKNDGSSGTKRRKTASEPTVGVKRSRKRRIGDDDEGTGKRRKITVAAHEDLKQSKDAPTEQNGDIQRNLAPDEAKENDISAIAESERPPHLEHEQPVPTLDSDEDDDPISALKSLQNADPVSEAMKPKPKSRSVRAKSTASGRKTTSALKRSKSTTMVGRKVPSEVIKSPERTTLRSEPPADKDVPMRDNGVTNIESVAKEADNPEFMASTVEEPKPASKIVSKKTSVPSKKTAKTKVTSTKKHGQDAEDPIARHGLEGATTRRNSAFASLGIAPTKGGDGNDSEIDEASAVNQMLLVMQADELDRIEAQDEVILDLIMKLLRRGSTRLRTLIGMSPEDLPSQISDFRRRRGLAREIEAAKVDLRTAQDEAMNTFAIRVSTALKNARKGGKFLLNDCIEEQDRPKMSEDPTQGSGTAIEQPPLAANGNPEVQHDGMVDTTEVVPEKYPPLHPDPLQSKVQASGKAGRKRDITERVKSQMYKGPREKSSKDPMDIEENRQMNRVPTLPITELTDVKKYSGDRYMNLDLDFRSRAILVRCDCPGGARVEELLADFKVFTKGLINRRLMTLKEKGLLNEVYGGEGDDMNTFETAVISGGRA